MVENFPAGKQPAAARKPSRLRNEVSPRSSEGETAAESVTVQVPDSQVVIPETQVEYAEEHADVSHLPLSPKSAAVFDQLTVKKKSGSDKPPAVPIQMLSKANLLGNNSFPPPPSVGFSFGQPISATSKSPSTIERSNSQPSTKAPPAEEPKITGK
jgi:hypothetical protein